MSCLFVLFTEKWFLHSCAYAQCRSNWFFDACAHAQCLSNLFLDVCAYAQYCFKRCFGICACAQCLPKVFFHSCAYAQWCFKGFCRVCAYAQYFAVGFSLPSLFQRTFCLRLKDGAKMRGRCPVRHSTFVEFFWWPWMSKNACLFHERRCKNAGVGQGGQYRFIGNLRLLLISKNAGLRP